MSGEAINQDLRHASSSGLNRLLHGRFRVSSEAFLQQSGKRIAQSRKHPGPRKREQIVPNRVIGMEFNSESLFTAFAMLRQSTVGEAELLG